MSSPFDSYSGRIRIIEYDSLISDSGCITLATRPTILGVLPVIEACSFKHDPNSADFNQDSRISYATGPYNFGGGAPWTTQWAAWVSESGVRIDRGGPITLPSNNRGDPLTLYPTSIFPAISLGFDNDGNPALAVQATTTEITVKHSAGEVTFTGTSPLLFNSTIMEGDTPDLACLYLKSDSPSAIFIRHLSENFAVERTLNEFIPVALSQLIGVERIGRRMVILAHGDSRDATLRSDIYPFSVAEDTCANSTAFYEGTYFLIAQAASVASGRQQVTTGLQSGAMFMTAMPIGATTQRDEGGQTKTGFYEGEYA